MGTTKMEAMQAQQNFAELLTRVEKGKERIVIEQQGQAVVAIISYEDLKRLEALEDTRDLAALQRAVVESDGETYSVEEVIAQYNEIHGTDFTVESVLND
jgi:prevent-host-death family protein